MILKKEPAGNSSNFAFDNFNQAVRRAVRIIIVLLVGMVIFSSAVETAEARIFTVTKTTDSDDNVCDADCSLREAMGRANSEITDDVVSFAPSVFSTQQTIVVPTPFFVSNSGGALTIDGPGANLLTLTRQFSGGWVISVGGSLTLNGVTITGGYGLDNNLAGGGIAKDGSGTLVVNNCVVTNNTADYGGGIAVNGGLTVINNSTISSNQAKISGGGLYTSTGSSGSPIVIINNSIFHSNRVYQASNFSGGGGIAQTGGTMTLTNVTVSQNLVNYAISTTIGTGGGILVTAGTMNLVNATIAGNYAPNSGGGVHAPLAMQVNARNSIIADNAGNTSADFTGTLTSQGYNLLETMPTQVVGNQTGNIYGQDPQLDLPANNGGATLTRALSPTSPALDAADPSNFPPTDQRGLARPADGNGDGIRRADIGAFERNAVPPYRNFDFDGDGRADVSVYRPSDGVWYLLRSTQGFTGVQFGIASDKIVPADYDGDGKTDIAVFRPADGVWYLLQSTQGFKAFPFGVSEDIPVPGDYDGDGKANLAVFRPSTGSWYIARPTGIPSQNFDTVPFGISTDKPIANADFDGDAKADVAVFRPSDGFWYRLNSSNNQFVATQFGIGEDKPVAADYDGDGKTDIAMFRPSDSVWYLLQSTNGFTPIQFGSNGDVPVPADYDGDGKANLAVFRPSANSWYIGRAFGSPSQNFDAVQFGVSTDKPVPSAFVP